MKINIILLSILIFGVIGLLAKSLGNRTLVLVDDLNIKTTHSSFFDLLQIRGYELSFFRADDSRLSLVKFGESVYDNLIIFAPETDDFGGKLDAGQVVDFIDEGHNVLIAVNSQLSPNIREIAKECGVYFDESGASVIDHVSYDESDSDGGHTLIVADDFIDSQIILGKDKLDPILFRGIGHDIDDNHNPLLHRILTASPYSYSHSLKKAIQKTPAITGKRTTLVSALQARNNARVVFSGSLDLFSNKFFNSPVQKHDSKKYDISGNKKFISELIQWNFNERGVLKAENIKHHRVDEENAPFSYRIKDDIEYSVDISEWNGEKWVPYKGKDVQLEFVRLDPYVRTYLVHNGKGTFTGKFKVPDVYGVFTFRLDYQRLGYTNILLKTIHPVRPFRHNEYERFIVTAYPYYAGAFSMMAGLFIFSIAFLFSSAPVVRDSKKES